MHHSFSDKFYLLPNFLFLTDALHKYVLSLSLYIYIYTDIYNLTHLESDILECEVKWALGSITTN